MAAEETQHADVSINEFRQQLGKFELAISKQDVQAKQRNAQSNKPVTLISGTIEHLMVGRLSISWETRGSLDIERLLVYQANAHTALNVCHLTCMLTYRSTTSLRYAHWIKL